MRLRRCNQLTGGRSGSATGVRLLEQNLPKAALPSAVGTAAAPYQPRNSQPGCWKRRGTEGSGTEGSRTIASDGVFNPAIPTRLQHAASAVLQGIKRGLTGRGEEEKEEEKEEKEEEKEKEEKEKQVVNKRGANKNDAAALQSSG